MSKQKIEDCYFEHNSTIFSEILGEDENYQRLKKAKRAAEEALQNVISKEAWKQYLALDSRRTWSHCKGHIADIANHASPCERNSL